MMVNQIEDELAFDVRDLLNGIASRMRSVEIKRELSAYELEIMRAKLIKISCEVDSVERLAEGKWY